MDILEGRLLKQFIKEHPRAESPLEDWVTKTRAAKWKNSADILRTFNSANLVGHNKWIFDIGGNNFRMAAMVWIKSGRVYILKVMTHEEYDKEQF